MNRPASADSGARQRGVHEFTLENRTAEEKTMNEEMNKQQEAEVKAEEDRREHELSNSKDTVTI